MSAKDSDESDGEVIGPLPTNPEDQADQDAAPPAKKIKRIPHEKIFLDNLPTR